MCVIPAIEDGGGAVVVKVNGKKEVLAINIKEEVVDPDDVEMLEDLVLSAVNGKRWIPRRFRGRKYK